MRSHMRASLTKNFFFCIKETAIGKWKNMQPLVVYSSKSGNTEKIALAIASELNCQSCKITKNVKTIPNLDNYDFFFIGTGITYGNPNEDLMDFLINANFPSVSKCAIFITWGGAGKTNQAVLSRLKTTLESKGQTVSEETFSCY